MPLSVEDGNIVDEETAEIIERERLCVTGENSVTYVDEVTGAFIEVGSLRRVIYGGELEGMYFFKRKAPTGGRKERLNEGMRNRKGGHAIHG